MPKETKRSRKHLKKKEKEDGKSRKAEKDKAIKDNDRDYGIERKQWT